MKKFLIKSTAGLFALSLLVAPMAVFAATAVVPPSDCRVRATVSSSELKSLTGVSGLTAISSGVKINSGTSPSAVGENFAVICAFSLVSWISNIIFLAIGALAVLVIALSALYFITAAGNDDRIKKAKSYLLYGAVGIAVAALANLVPAIVKGFFGA